MTAFGRSVIGFIGVSGRLLRTNIFFGTTAAQICSILSLVSIDAFQVRNDPELESICEPALINSCVHCCGSSYLQCGACIRFVFVTQTSLLRPLLVVL